MDTQKRRGNSHVLQDVDFDNGKESSAHEAITAALEGGTVYFARPATRGNAV
jgi:IS30 family transposase